MNTESLITSATDTMPAATVNRTEQLRQRSALVFGAGGALSLIIIIRLFFLATADLDEGIAAETEGCQLKFYATPALRGRLLDANGLPLAWSERVFKLVYEKPASPSDIWKDMFHLEGTIGIEPDVLAMSVTRSPSAKVCLKPSLTPGEIERLANGLTESKGRFRVEQGFIRHIASASPAIHAMVGKTWQNSKRQVGVKGFERKYNRELTGEDGCYRVLIDRDGKWVNGSWKELRAPRPGYDKYTDISLSQPE